jgi:hypothetical protein
VNRGGYRCRHSLIPYDPAWDNIEAVQNKIEIKEDGKPRVRPENVSSVSTQLKSDAITIIKTTVVQKTLQKQITENAKDKRYLGTKKQTVLNPFQRKFEEKEFLISRFSTKDVGKVNLRNLSDRAASIVATVVEELNELADIYNVPKIRSIVSTAKSKSIASMGDGSLTVNYKYFNNPSNKGKTIKSATSMDDEDYLSGFKLGDDVSGEITSTPRNYDQWLEHKKTWVRPHNAFNYFEDEADKIRQTLYHEFAHAIHQLKNYSATNYRYPPLERALEKINFTKTGATRYSDKNAKEWFCENFSLYHMGRKDLVDPEFIDFLEREVLK